MSDVTELRLTGELKRELFGWQYDDGSCSYLTIYELDIDDQDGNRATCSISFQGPLNNAPRLENCLHGLAERAREDAEADRREREEHERTPSKLQQMMAEEVAKLLGVWVDPKAVREVETEGLYHVAELDIYGLRFIGNYIWIWDRNAGHYGQTGSPLEVWKHGFFGRFRKRDVSRLGDLDGWL